MKILIKIFFLLILSNPLYAQLQNIPLITVEGEAFIKVKPDYVILGFKVSREINLNSQGNTTAFDIFKTEDTKIKIFGFDDKNISESQIEVEKSIYVKEVFITVYDLNKLDNILLELNKLGFSEFTYFDYRIKNLTDLKYQANAKAMNSAKTKATLLAKELGQTIGKAHLIEEENYQDNNWYNFQKDDKKENLTFIQGADDYVIEPGFVVITAKIKVSFDLNK